MAAGLPFVETLIAAAFGGLLTAGVGVFREIAESRRQARKASLDYNRSRLEQRRDRAFELIAKLISITAKVYNARTWAQSAATEHAVIVGPDFPGRAELLVHLAPTTGIVDQLRGEIQTDWQAILVLVELLDDPPESQSQLRDACVALGTFLGVENQLGIAASRDGTLSTYDNNTFVAVTTAITAPCRQIAHAAQAELTAEFEGRNRRRGRNQP